MEVARILPGILGRPRVKLRGKELRRFLGRNKLRGFTQKELFQERMGPISYRVLFPRGYLEVGTIGRLGFRNQGNQKITSKPRFIFKGRGGLKRNWFTGAILFGKVLPFHWVRRLGKFPRLRGQENLGRKGSLWGRDPFNRNLSPKFSLGSPELGFQGNSLEKEETEGNSVGHTRLENPALENSLLGRKTDLGTLGWFTFFGRGLTPVCGPQKGAGRGIWWGK